MPGVVKQFMWWISRSLLISVLLYGLGASAKQAPEQTEMQASPAYTPLAQAPEAQILAQPASIRPAQGDYRPLVIQSSRHDASASLRSIGPKTAPAYRQTGAPPEIPNPVLPKALNAKETAPGILPLAQTDTGKLSQAAGLTPDPLWSFDGVSNLFGGWPPDTQGDIGQDHYVQWINLHFAIWELDKINHTATLVVWTGGGQYVVQRFWRGVRVKQRWRPDHII